MRNLFVVLLLFCLNNNSLAQGFAVVELFTSQGCSSCPAADKNLSDILAHAEGQNVYGLSFHVDYWNYIGWKDPYSSKIYSARQRSYAKALNSNVYTPQMVVNGKQEFVGSNRDIARVAIASALDEPSGYTLRINEKSIEGEYIMIRYVLDRDPHGERLNVALVERDIENYVSRGENSGRTLHHDNVVRYFETLDLQKSGSLKIDLAGVDKNKSAVILYAQNKQWRVVAGQSIVLSEVQ